MDYCQHGHKVDLHPACFVVPNRPKWYVDAKKRNGIGFLDIETTGRDAMFSTMLTWAIKPLGKPVVSMTRKNFGSDDSEDFDLVAGLVKEMCKYNLLVTFFGRYFDIPFARTRALEQGIWFPPNGSIYHLDLYFVAKSRLKLDRRSLEVISHLWDLKDKTHIIPKVWRQAHRGNKKAMQYILNHNVKDVILLEKVFKKLEPHVKSAKTSI